MIVIKRVNNNVYTTLVNDFNVTEKRMISHCQNREKANELVTKLKGYLKEGYGFIALINFIEYGRID
jgi:uncharacterized membrane protein YkvI